MGGWVAAPYRPHPSLPPSSPPIPHRAGHHLARGQDAVRELGGGHEMLHAGARVSLVHGALAEELGDEGVACRGEGGRVGEEGGTGAARAPNSTHTTPRPLPPSSPFTFQRRVVGCKVLEPVLDKEVGIAQLHEHFLDGARGQHAQDDSRRVAEVVGVCGGSRQGARGGLTCGLSTGVSARRRPRATARDPRRPLRASTRPTPGRQPSHRSSLASREGGSGRIRSKPCHTAPPPLPPSPVERVVPLVLAVDIVVGVVVGPVRI